MYSRIVIWNVIIFSLLILVASTTYLISKFVNFLVSNPAFVASPSRPNSTIDPNGLKWKPLHFPVRFCICLQLTTYNAHERDGSSSRMDKWTKDKLFRRSFHSPQPIVGSLFFTQTNFKTERARFFFVKLIFSSTILLWSRKHAEPNLHWETNHQLLLLLMLEDISQPMFRMEPSETTLWRVFITTSNQRDETTHDSLFPRASVTSRLLIYVLDRQ